MRGAQVTRGAWVRCVVSFACVCILALWSSDAPAESPTLAGSWSAGPLFENMTVTTWVDECGPKPKANPLGGGSYKVTVVGDELVFSGAQPFRTDSCFVQEGARRVSHSATPSLRMWKTRCESPPDNPLKATITTVVRATNDDTIVLTETARYTTTMATGTCSADVERSRTFSIVAREGAASGTTSTTSTTSPTTNTTNTTNTTTTKTSASSTKAPPIACDTLGAPAALEIRPRKKLLRPGEEFTFKARLLDDKGCELESKLAYRLAPESSTMASSINIDAATGRVRVVADAEPAVATLVVEAKLDSGTKSARVTVEIVSDQHYAELLGTSGFDDAGADEQAVSVTITGGQSEKVTIDPPADPGTRRRLAYFAIVGGSLTLLALGGVVAYRRGAANSDARKRAQAGSARRADPGPPRPRSPRMSGQTPMPIAGVGGAPRPTSTVIGTPDPNAGAALVGSELVMVCPICAERAPLGGTFCPNDGHRLVEVRSPAHQPPLPMRPTGPTERICPVCGTRYPRDTGFCGSDGVELVPLN